MKITIAQINAKVGSVSENLKSILQHIEQAKQHQRDWILFPELSLVGYPPRDLLDYPRILRENDAALAALQKASLGIGVIVGGLKANPSPVGKKFFNCAFVFRDQKLLHTYSKQLLPSYDVFEEERFFEAGQAPGVFEWQGQRLGLAICEDIWNRAGFLERKYAKDPVRDLKDKNLSALFVLSASPFELGKPQVREKLVSQVAKDVQCPVFYCNQVGGNDELIFDGSSLIAESTGQISGRAKPFHETAVLWEASRVLESGVQWPKEETEWLWNSLVFGIREYFQKTHQKKIGLGLSGGIDSSVAAALAVAALGKENVLGVSLPSRFTSKASTEDAKFLAEQLGIAFREISIEPVFQTFQNTLAVLNPSGLTLENLQPRIRMILLMAICNENHLLLLNTSNKSEIATGYSTLYGDSAGALAPLGDLTKNQVRKLAHWINRESEVVPRRVIERAPSAELRPDQKDEDSLPPYEVLDGLVEATLTGKQGPEELVSGGFDEKWVSQFGQLHRVSEFKRKQFPPVLRVSSKAFGMGRRMPIACRSYSDK